MKKREGVVKMMHVWGGPYGAGMYGPGIISILLWIAIIVGILFMVRYLKANGGIYAVQPKAAEGKESEAVGILKERFARGEIEKEEYEEKVKIIRST
jgi:putative membrane protein